MPHRTVREKFVVSPIAKEFGDIAASKPFEDACHAALLAYVEEQRLQSDPNLACHAYFMLMGARQIIDLLREIHLPPEPAGAVKGRQLQPPK